MNSPKQNVALAFESNKPHILKLGATTATLTDAGSTPAIDLGFKSGEQARAFDRHLDNLGGDNPLRQLLTLNRVPVHRQIIATLGGGQAA